MIASPSIVTRLQWVVLGSRRLKQAESHGASMFKLVQIFRGLDQSCHLAGSGATRMGVGWQALAQTSLHTQLSCPKFLSHMFHTLSVLLFAWQPHPSACQEFLERLTRYTCLRPERCAKYSTSKYNLLPLAQELYCGRRFWAPRMPCAGVRYHCAFASAYIRTEARQMFVREKQHPFLLYPSYIQVCVLFGFS